MPQKATISIGLHEHIGERALARQGVRFRGIWPCVPNPTSHKYTVRNHQSSPIGGPGKGDPVRAFDRAADNPSSLPCLCHRVTIHWEGTQVTKGLKADLSKRTGCQLC